MGITLRSSAAAADFDKPGYLYSCTTSAGSCKMLPLVCLLAGACSLILSLPLSRKGLMQSQWHGPYNCSLYAISCVHAYLLG